MLCEGEGDVLGPFEVDVECEVEVEFDDKDDDDISFLLSPSPPALPRSKTLPASGLRIGTRRL